MNYEKEPDNISIDTYIGDTYIGGRVVISKASVLGQLGLEQLLPRTNVSYVQNIVESSVARMAQ